MLNPTTLFKSLKTSEKNETDAVRDSTQENYGSLYQVQGEACALRSHVSHVTSMVFQWGHSRSRASPFYIKIKTRGFHTKTSNAAEINWFKKTCGSRMRECEGEGARVRQRGRNLAEPVHSRILESRVV